MLAIDGDVDPRRSRYAVTTQGLILLNRDHQLRPSAYYPLRGTWAELNGGWLLLGSGTRLRIVILVEQKPPRRFD